MRYPDSGGLSREARAKRETVRLEAAQMLTAGLDTGEIAERLRVTRKSVNEWRRAWKGSGVAALVSKGPGGARCRLDRAQLDRLQTELETGPAAHGWTEDQRWTLARVAALIAELFGIRYTLRGVSYLLHRIGWTPQVPTHRAAERDEQAVTTWVRKTWPRIKGGRPGSERGSASPTSPASR
jgi:putative transposase